MTHLFKPLTPILEEYMVLLSWKALSPKTTQNCSYAAEVLQWWKALFCVSSKSTPSSGGTVEPQLQTDLSSTHLIWNLTHAIRQQQRPLAPLCVGEGGHACSCLHACAAPDPVPWLKHWRGGKPQTPAPQWELEG